MNDARPTPTTKMRWGGWALLALIFLFTLPPVAEEIGVGLDPSWRLGMHLLRERGLVLGRDVVFTYGPWGFLCAPLTLVRSQWAAAAAYALAIHVALFGAVAAWMRRSAGGRIVLIAPLTFVLFAPSIEYHVVLALLLWLFLTITAQRERWVAAALLGAVGASLLLTKFSTGTAALVVIAAGALSAAWIGRRTSALSLGAGACLGGFAAGVLSLGSPAAFATFLRVSMQIAAFHQDAMQRRGPLWQAAAVFVAFALLAWSLIRAFRDRRHAVIAASPLILPAIGLFAIACKHAFGRQETHVIHAFSMGGTVLAWIVLEMDAAFRPMSRWLGVAGAAILSIGSLSLRPPGSVIGLPGVPGVRAQELARAIAEFRDPGSRSRARERLRDQLPLGLAVASAVAGHTVDVLTLEISMIEAWDLRWAPRKVLQEYIVASPGLDGMDADGFAGSSAPERLLVNLQGVDTRHPFMDAPLTWRQLFLHYEPIAQDARWLVLGRRETSRSMVVVPLQRISAQMGSAIPVPESTSGHIEIAVALRPSWLGRLAAIPWVLPEVRVGLESRWQQSLRRILPPTAVNAFPLLDPWPNTASELREAFTAAHPDTPRSVGFITWNPWAWNQTVDVIFYQVEWRDGS